MIKPIRNAQESRISLFSKVEKERIELSSKAEDFISGKRGLSVSKVLLNNPEGYVSAVKTLNPINSCFLCGGGVILRGEDSEEGRAIYQCTNDSCGVFYDLPLK
ncbi:MAG: hypothetical protein WC494_02025 [Candidatus Pacearchaeota archaeon]